MYLLKLVPNLFCNHSVSSELRHCSSLTARCLFAYWSIQLAGSTVNTKYSLIIFRIMFIGLTVECRLHKVPCSSVRSLKKTDHLCLRDNWVILEYCDSLPLCFQIWMWTTRATLHTRTDVVFVRAVIQFCSVKAYLPNMVLILCHMSTHLCQENIEL